MKQLMCAATVALAVAAAPAFAQQANPPAKPAQGHADHDKTAHKAGGAADSQWVMKVAGDSMAEVELGKIAAEKASSPDVKKFAQRMVDDHTKANDELKTLAQNKNITLPTTLDATHKAHVDRMSKMSGEAFDKSYMRDMVADHQKAVTAFRTESTSGKDPDVKAWAAKTLPTLQEHLKMAQDANKSVVGTTGTKPAAKSKK